MGSKSQDETGRFMRAIAAFSASPEKVSVMGRELSPGVPVGIYAILSEINETVLRRRLVFRTELDGELSMEVSERRLLKVEAMPSGLAARFEGLVGRSLTHEDAPRLCALFDAFWSGNDRIWVMSQLPSNQSGDLGGLSVRHLFEIAGKSAVLECPVQLTSALQETSQRVVALVMTRKGEVVLAQGDTALSAALTGELAATTEKDTASSCVTVWFGGPDSQQARLLMVLPPDRILVACDPAQAPALFDLWRPLIGTVTRQ